MNFFYDILINLNDNRAFMFYEWSKQDNVIHLKKTPIFKINTKDLKTFINYNIKVDKEFLDLIYNKTESYDQNNKYIEYMALFSDENNSILLEFDQEGNSIFRSHLLLEEELDVLEIAYSLKKENISYQKKEPLLNYKELRQVRNVKHFLELELKTLYEEKNISKLRYLYNEIFNRDNNNLKDMYEELLKIIKSDFNESHLQLLEIVKLSYKHLST